MTEFATGLMIGAAEAEEAIQRRKELYRQDLLEQIAEQRRNRKKEKELELKVAATGAIDPEKEPDRIKQFGSAKREHEGRRQDVLFKPGMGLDTLRANEDKKTQDVKREPPERPSMAFQSPVLEYSATPGQLGNTTSTGVRNSGITAFSENFHKGLSGAIGEIVPPRPLSHHGISSPEIGAYPSDRHHRPKEHVESYRDALKQQIEDRKERRRQEREENERYEAKVEAEMKASEPWGRGGAGAPLRDDRGNLIISPFTQPSPYARGNVFRELPTPQQLREQKKYKECLKQQIEEKRRMEVERRKEVRLEEKEQQEERKKIECRHRPNDEAYVYPESRNRRAIASPYWNGDTPRPEDKDSSLQKISNEVSSFTQPSPYARGNVFREFLTSQQLLQQKRYRESLKQQIEEKRRMEVERREQLRLEVEKEKRLAEDTAHKQRQFEEEQEKKRRKKMQQNPRNQELTQQANEQRRDAEKKKKDEEKKTNDAMKQQYEQGFRTRSPPIPTIQKQLGIHTSPRPPSGDSQRSATASPQNTRNQELIRQADERRREAEKKSKEANDALKQQYEQERQARLEQEFRTRSPPIPTIQKRLGIQISPRPPSGDSQRSATASSQNSRNQEVIRQAEERYREAEKKRKEEEENANVALKQQYEQERKARLEQEFRTCSPPIPTIQKRLGIQISPRPPSGDSQRSATASSQNTRNQELIRKAEEWRREAEKKMKEEEEKENDALKQQYKQERRVLLEHEFRTRSPPIPTIQKKLGIEISPRLPSGDSQRSASASSQNAKNQGLIRQADEQRKEAEKKKKEEAEKTNNALKQQYEQERKAPLKQEFRTRSPPIPTIQKRLGIQISSRPPSEDQQNVIGRLSDLRRHLRNEQKHLKVQLLQSDREDSQTPLKNSHPRDLAPPPHHQDAEEADSWSKSVQPQPAERHEWDALSTYHV